MTLSRFATSAFVKTGLAVLALTLSAAATQATPVLKSDVTVNASIVTVGDMFDGADLLAERALFRAPAPGTTGRVSVEAVRTAAAKIGLTDFRNPGLAGVTVARFGEIVDTSVLSALIENELVAKSYMADGVHANIRFDTALPVLNADTNQNPARLDGLRYQASSGRFSARFTIAGRAEPFDISGNADLMVDVPMLVNSMNAGAILTADDVEMRPVPVRVADTGSFPSLDQVIGKQLRRPARIGKMLQPGDLTEPVLIARSDVVTLVYRSGPLTLTVKGKALASAAKGERISVLNMMSNKVISGIAADQGTVEIASLAPGEISSN